MTKKAEKNAETPAESTEQLLGKVMDKLESMGNKMEGLAVRQEEIKDKQLEQDTLLEAHGELLREEVKIPELVVGLEKEDFPEKVQADAAKGIVGWHRVTPRIDYLPGISHNGFVVPCHKGVTTWMTTPFVTEAMGRNIIK